jgi:hypothetical protein
VAHDTGREVLVLLGGGELTINKKERNFKEVGLGSKLLNGVATITEDTLGTINEADGGASRDSVQESRVEVAETSTGVLDLKQLVAVDSVASNGKSVLLAIAVINDGQRVPAR